MGRSINKLVPDLKKGLAAAEQRAAVDTVYELKKRGPYWSGDFQNAWDINLDINNKVFSNRVGRSLREVPSPLPRVVTPVAEPAEDPHFRGYAIGNRMLYASYAMDIEPWPGNPYRRQNAYSTAPRDWFELYINGRGNQTTLKKAVDREMHRRGFR